MVKNDINSISSLTGHKIKRIAAIDGLRAFAFALVFIYHAFPTYFSGGFIGVDIFFVISGYVITQSLIRDGIKFKLFYIRRFFRIIPPVIPVLLFVLFVKLFDINIVSLEEALYALFSIMNWVRVFEITDGSYVGHFWSLSIEEQFYLFWPLVLLSFMKFNNKLIICLLLVIIFTIIQLSMFYIGVDFNRIYNGTDTRISQILIGCSLCFLNKKYQFNSLIASICLISLILFGIFIDKYSSFYISFGIPLIAILSAFIILHMANDKSFLHKIFEQKLILWGGSRSYALYLWHYPVLGICFQLGSEYSIRPLISVIIATIITTLFSEISYRYLEKPSRNMRLRIEDRYNWNIK